MKINAAVIIMLMSVLIMFPVFADDDEHAQQIDDVLKLIMEEQNVTDINAIDPDKVSDDLLEELGDAVMSLAQPNEDVHEWMDEMMGGEGSRSLRLAHIHMGLNYLTNPDWFQERGMGSRMMGYGMMGGGMMNYR